MKEVRSFLGHAGFYRRFIKDFSKIANPFSNLLQKDIVFDFGERYKDASNTLKKALTNTPIIHPHNSHHLQPSTPPHRTTIKHAPVRVKHHHLRTPPLQPLRTLVVHYKKNHYYRRIIDGQNLSVKCLSVKFYRRKSCSVGNYRRKICR